MKIATAGNTLVPSILALEGAGFVVSVHEGQVFSAVRAHEVYIGESPESVLGLVKLVELKGWNWTSTDEEIEDTIRRLWLAVDRLSGDGARFQGRITATFEELPSKNRRIAAFLTLHASLN